MVLSNVKKILVVRMRHLGDVLLTSPLLTCLKKAYPTAQIDVFINKDSFSVLEGHPAVSRYFLYDRSWKKLPFFKKIRKEWQLLKEVRQEKYDLVLNLTEGDRGAITAFYSGARYRAGFDLEKSGFLGKRRLFTHLVKICPYPRHTVERQLDVLRCLGIHPSLEERALFFHIPDTSREKMTNLYGKDFILIHPVSRWMFKSPPASFFIELIQKLHERGERIILSGSSEKEELILIEQILSGLPHIPIVSVAAKISLKELGALIEFSRFLITVDSLPLHISSALKAPVVAIFGPSSDINWGPWENPQGYVIAANVSCRPCYMDGCGGSKKSDCLNQISVDSVIQTIDENLRQNRQRALPCFEVADPLCRP